MQLVGRLINRMMLFIQKKISLRTLIMGLFIIGMVISMLPLIVAACYNHPVADDYSFGYTIYHAANQGDGIGKIFLIIQAIWGKVVSFYNTWGGYYTSIFISALRPSIFNEEFAFLHTIILLGGLMYGVFGTMRRVLGQVLKQTKATVVIVSCVTMYLLVQYVPSAAETLYWFNGGVSYTLLFALSLLLMAEVYCLMESTTRITVRRIVGISCFAFVVAGGHYPVTLPTLCILVAIGIDALSKRMLEKRNRIAVCIVVVIFIVGFIITVAAPGNYVRMQHGETNSLIKSIAMSVHGCLCLVQRFLTSKVMLGGIIISIIVIKFGRKETIKMEMNPLYITFISFCVMFAAYIPGYFASGIEAQAGDGRYPSVMFFWFIILFVINVVYYTIWAGTKLQNTNEMTHMGMSVLIIVILFLSIGNFNQTQTWATVCLQSVVSGELKQFDEEMDQRLELYLDTEQKNITITPVTVRPKVLFFSDASDPSETWMLDAIARYYGKDKIEIAIY